MIKRIRNKIVRRLPSRVRLALRFWVTKRGLVFHVSELPQARLVSIILYLHNLKFVLSRQGMWEGSEMEPWLTIMLSESLRRLRQRRRPHHCVSVGYRCLPRGIDGHGDVQELTQIQRDHICVIEESSNGLPSED